MRIDFHAFLFGGKGGIRTHGRISPTPIFETGTLNQLRHLSNIIKNQLKHAGFGAEGGVRTLAPLSRPNCLANNPLHHLGTSAFSYNKIKSEKYKYVFFTFYNLSLIFCWRRGWDSNPRYATNARQFSRLVP